MAAGAMGTKTRAVLMAQAGLAASNDEGQSYVRGWLDDWLGRVAKEWQWPVLKKRVLNLPITQGAAYVGVGVGYSCNIKGQTLTTHIVHDLLGGYVLWRSQAAFSPNGRASVRPLYDGNPDNDPDNSDPLTRQGAPTTVKVRNDDNGVLLLYLDPTADRALYLNFDVLWIPPAIGALAASDTQVPWYPNDRTLVQACKCALLEMDTGGEGDSNFDNEMAKLGGMVVDDRDWDGSKAGDNEILGLDPGTFVPTGR